MSDEVDKRIGVKASYTYEESPNYERYYVHGALGGINTDYDFQIKFYSQDFDGLESDRIRDLIRSGEEDPEMNIIREFQFGVSMSMKSVKELAVWLINKINIFENTYGNIAGTKEVEGFE